MSRITVAGILTNPLGEPMSATPIRVTTISSEDSFPGSIGDVDTAVDGSYTFTLPQGAFEIEVLQVDEYTQPRVVIVDESTADPIELTVLMELGVVA